MHKFVQWLMTIGFGVGIIAAVGLGLVPAASAQTTQLQSATQEAQAGSRGVDDSTQREKPLSGTVEDTAVTFARVKVGDQTIAYRATAAHMQMKDETGALKATIFFVAYEQLAAADETAASSAASAPASQPVAGDRPETRPLTFVFNGGPGAAAVWLHLGTAGPRRVDLAGDGLAPAPPYRLVENEYTWLDATDLVFIDPVGTGFSRPAKGEKHEEFYGVKQDIAWVADFIRLYLTQYERWASPLFLAGESYGTTRAAGLSGYLLDRYGIALNGIVLISSVLDFQTISIDAGNDLPYMLYLPSYAAIARYHKRLGSGVSGDLEALTREIESWAQAEYLPALAYGDALSKEERQSIIQRLSNYTSLPADLIDKADLRIRPSTFQKHLLADERRIIGRFDARVSGADPEPISTWPHYDPSLSMYLPLYSATFNDYVRRRLEFRSVLPYEVLSDKVRPWKFGEEGTGYLNVADALRSAMMGNPHLKVMFASGYFDLATPFFSTVYTVEHLGLPPALRSNVTEQFYTGGHMMYHDRPSLVKLHEDIASFIAKAVPTRPR